MIYVSVLDFLQTAAKNADEMPLKATDKLGWPWMTFHELLACSDHSCSDEN